MSLYALARVSATLAELFNVSQEYYINIALLVLSNSLLNAGSPPNRNLKISHHKELFTAFQAIITQKTGKPGFEVSPPHG